MFAGLYALSTEEIGLRQEIKGMTVSGTVRKPRSRSNSASTPASADSRKSPPRSSSRQPSSERPSKAKQEAAQGAADKDIASTPRSVSENFSKDTLASVKVSNISSGHVVDTRSKTINAVAGHPPTGDEVMDIMNNKRTSGSRIARYGTSKSADSSGYGKPLVTPMNKKLTIRRDQPWPPPSLNGSTEKSTPSIVSGTKSPTRSWKAENRESSPPNAPKRPLLTRTKIPTKASISGNKLRASNTSPNVFPDTKIPIMRSNIGARSLRPSVSSLHRSNSRSPPRHGKPVDNPQEKVSAPTIRMKHALAHHANDCREIKPWSSDTNKTPPRSPNRGRSPIPKRIPAEPARKQTTSSKDAQHLVPDRSKQSLNKVPVAPLSRPSSTAHSNKSFKPQLEDIKSSYLLLNKNAQDLNMKASANAGSYKSNVPQPNAFNEQMRKQMLTEVKKKFQTKRFFTDSKYDKIEGLNWITWK